jgi:hypothetical protein
MGNEAIGAGGLPRLEEFDREFGSEPGAILREPRRWVSGRLLVGLVLAAGLGGLAALVWVNADVLRSLAPSGPMTLQSANASRSALDEKVGHLVHEIATLKRELGELSSAHQQALERISSLQADHDLRQALTSHWYSDLTALTFESASEPRPSAVAPRRSVVRPEVRTSRRGESAEPLSLEAPQ